MKRICLLTCYMGPLPNYFAYFAASCKKNTDIDFVVIGDHVGESRSDANIQYLKMDLGELNAFASARLGTAIALASAWKINELKPLFGRIFQDLLHDYDFWGWCDLDIIWGRLRHFLTDSLLGSYDVISSKAQWTAGHFTLLRNTERCNTLFLDFKGIFELLNNPTYFAFEECCHRWDNELLSDEALERLGLPLSMYDIVKRASAAGELRALFRDMVREHPQPINYIYVNGSLTDLNTGEEFMYYHLLTVKKIWRFYIAPYRPGALAITRLGIRPVREARLVWMLRRAYSCYRGIQKTVKKTPVLALLKKLTGTRERLR